MMKRARIIYNPTSGRELFKKSLPEVLQKLEQAGYEASCHATTGPGDATVAARQAVERKFDVVIAAGGDGTLNEVVNGLVGHEFRPKFGIIQLERQMTLHVQSVYLVLLKRQRILFVKEKLCH